MSLSGSSAEDFNKTNDGMLHYDDVKGPEPTAENPAGVFPDSTGPPAAAGSIPGSGADDHGGDVRQIFGNPEVFKDTFGNLSTAFTQAINRIDDEAGSGLGSKAKLLKRRLLEMRNEVDGWRMGKDLPEAAVTGEANDSVSRTDGQAGGLYAE